MNIFNIPKEVEEAVSNYLNCFDNETGELIVREEEEQKRLTEMTLLENKKDKLLEWILQTRQNSIARQEAIVNEIKRLHNLLDREDKTEEKMDDLIRYFLPSIEKPVNIGLFTVSYRKSPGSLVILDEDLVSKEFVTIKETKIVDKNEIKKRIKNGDTFPWAEIKKENILTIK